jgi:hypothetical protein
MSAPTSSPALAASLPSPRTPAGPASAPTATPAPPDEAAPTASELLAFVQDVAADRALIASLPLDPGDRTWVRLEGPGGSEAWLISWPPGAETGWHDHGGSVGAFATAHGALREESAAVPEEQEDRDLLDLAGGAHHIRHMPAGRGRYFGAHHVHQVVNPSDDEHAVSVHAYYPPLPLMRRYSRHSNTLRFELVELPEAW